MSGKADPNFEFIKGDIRHHDRITKSSKDCDVIFQTAAQTTVTKSLDDPRTDFEINSLGTFNVLEAARINNCGGVVFCSTNKVFGANVNKVPLKQSKTRYMFSGKYTEGIDEKFPIDSEEHTPYGVSKLSGDQYVRDYNTIYGLPGVVNRMSCIYGEHQFGNTDQGWVVHFIYSTITGKPITIYGDGKQVRDILYGCDLAKLFEKEAENITKISGRVFTVGGGRKNTISLLELITKLENLLGKKAVYSFSEWRPADQKVYYSNIASVKKILGWQPETSVDAGIKNVIDWVSKNQDLF